jgi:hypothetical protein
MKKHELLLIHWEDSTCRGGWHKRETAPTFGDQVITVGFLVTRSRHHLTIAQSMCEDRTVDNSWLIPRSSIRSIRILDKVAAPKARE